MKRSLTFAALLTALCLVLGFVSLTLTGCSSVGRALNIVNPTYSIRNVRPRVDIALPLSASSIDFDFDLGVSNPNSVGLKLAGVDFNLFINDNQIVNGISTDRVSIPARGFGETHLRTRVGYENIRSLFREVADMVQGNRAHYEVRGNAHYDTPIGRMTFPVTVYSSAR